LRPELDNLRTHLGGKLSLLRLGQLAQAPIFVPLPRYDLAEYSGE
jgi:hypothetical protein